MFNYNPGPEEPAATVKTSQGDYRVMVSRGAIEAIGPEMRQAGVNGRAFLIADYAMFPLLVRRAHEALERGGYETHALILELGEEAKTIATATQGLRVARRAARRTHRLHRFHGRRGNIRLGRIRFRNLAPRRTSGARSNISRRHG